MQYKKDFMLFALNETFFLMKSHSPLFVEKWKKNLHIHTSSVSHWTMFWMSEFLIKFYLDQLKGMIYRL